MNLDGVFIDLVRSGQGLSGVAIAAAIFYLAWEVKALRKSVHDVSESVKDVRKTIGDKVFPRIEANSAAIAELQGRYATWALMRGVGE